MPGDQYTRLIGMNPPGRGGTPTAVRVGIPRITRNDMDWDFMEETLWVRDVNVITIGSNRSGVTALTTDRFIVESVTITRFLAGYPLLKVVSKGWAATKAARWEFRRNVTGDTSTFSLGGMAYAIATEFSASLPSGTYNAVGATAIPAQRWGLINGVLTPGSFQPLQSGWGSYYQPGANGWYIAGRDVQTLPDNATSKFVTTFACWMNPNGTAPV